MNEGHIVFDTLTDEELSMVELLLNDEGSSDIDDFVYDFELQSLSQLELN